MSTFTDIFLPQEIIIENTIYPLYKEMAISYPEAATIDDGTDIKVVEGIEAIKVWVYKNFKTWRNKYNLYSSSFGTDLYNEIGYVYNEEIKKQLMYAEILDNCMVLPYITNVSNFTTVADMETGSVSISFKITTIYGELEEVLNV